MEIRKTIFHAAVSCGNRSPGAGKNLHAKFDFYAILESFSQIANSQMKWVSFGLTKSITHS